MNTSVDIIKMLFMFCFGLPIVVGWAFAPAILGFHMFQIGSVIGFIIAAIIAVPFYASGFALMPFYLIMAKK